MNIATLFKRHASAAVLASSAVLLSVYVLVVDRDSLTTEEVEGRKNRLVPAWRADDVTRVQVELHPVGGELASYTLTRPPKGTTSRPWSLTVGETTYPAEEQVVDSLLFGFERARILREVPASSVDRATFGLTEPRARYVIAMGDLNYTIAIGAPSSSNEGVYAEVEGRGVYVVSKGDAEQWNVSPDDLRSHTFVPYLSTELDGLDLTGAGGTRKFERAPWKGGRGSGFRFAEGSEGPKGKRVDGGRLDQVLVSLGRMQAQKFLEKADADKTAKADVTITMIPKIGEHGVIEVGGECPSEPDLVVVVRRSPGYLAACAPKGILSALSRPATEFVDDSMVGATVDEIIELRIERDKDVLDMARSGTGFHVREPKEAQIEAEVGNHLLTDIVEARGEFAPDDATMPEGAVTRVRIISQGGATENGDVPKREELVEVGPAVDGKHLVIRHEDGAKLYIGAAAASSLQPSDLLLKSTQIIDRNSADVLELRVQHGDERQVFTQSGQDLTLVEPKGQGLEADRAIATRAMGAFVTLQAIRWVSSTVEPNFALDHPRYVIQAKLGASDDHAAATLELKLGAFTDDGVYASLSSETGVFLVPRNLEEAFERSFVSREAFALNPGAADKIEIEAGTTTVTLVRDGRQLRLRAAGGSTKSDARAAEIEKELLGLDAIFAVRAGPAAADQGLEQPAMKIRITPRKNPQDAEDPKTIVVSIGGAGALQGVPIRYARRDDIDATYAVSLMDVKRLEDLVSGK
ncbi:MAG: DUF4340 domain-containing protein [Polyangiaceae bacterium]|nr:DUF4340 domain-containing protein [Polyangiaceae bacterium]